MGEIAIISFTNYPKGQNRPCMEAVMVYTKREAKTLWQGQSLVSGINFRPESVYDDFLSTKLLYHKDDKILFFHMVQFFPKGADVDPVTAHVAAIELGKYFDGREVLVCTHTDRGHVHSHFIINSVSLEDGRKLHISEPELIELPLRRGKRPEPNRAVADEGAGADAKQLLLPKDRMLAQGTRYDEAIWLVRQLGYRNP